jgi:uncharacterized protein YkwD
MRHHPLTTQQLRSISVALAASVVLWLPAVACTQTPGKPIVVPDSEPTPAQADPIVEQLVEAHNKERAKEKLPPLKFEPRLTEAARGHAKDMAEHGFMSHTGSDESTPAQRVVNAGYRYLKTGENVAEGYKDVPEVMRGWLESPGHRHNIFGDYSEIGVAKVLGKDDKPYWCVNFGIPMPKFDPANAAKDLAKRINEKRKAAELPDLVIDEKLTKAAQAQAISMAKKKSQAGTTPTLEGVDMNLYLDVAVSTAGGNPDAESVVKMLFSQDRLKDQVLGKYSRIGTGYATAEDGVPYWCLILGTPSRPATVIKNKTRR